MTKPITFSQFEEVLSELGFRKNIIADMGVAYEHHPTKTLFVVRLHQPGEVVPGKVLLAARLQFDGRGVIEAEAFEARLRAIAA